MHSYAHSQADVRPAGPVTDTGLSRRGLLRLASVAAAGASIGTGMAGSVPSAAAASAQWPGHKPGRIYLGMSAANLADAMDDTGPVGLYRTYYRWSDVDREVRNIKKDHAASRLPWISFKPPYTSRGGWAAVASGSYDADIRKRARAYAGLSKPVIVTFNHEPHNDSTGTPAEFARAWCRIHDVMKQETGLRNVVSVPILGEWEFSPVNRNGEPEAYVTGAVLDRCHFLGTDLYQNKTGQTYAERLGGIVDWLDRKGHSTKMVGLGETGATDGFGSPGAVDWWTDGWNWAAAHTSRVAAISYFNSTRNNNLVHNWKLTESAAKLRAYRKSLSSGTACRL